jgi:hypothetical protein
MEACGAACGTVRTAAVLSARCVRFSAPVGKGTSCNVKSSTNGQIDEFTGPGNKMEDEERLSQIRKWGGWLKLVRLTMAEKGGFIFLELAFLIR